MLGDVNFDGTIDGTDATLTLRDYTLKISGMPHNFLNNLSRNLQMLMPMRQ